METIEYAPIGLIHSPFAETSGMPIQPAGARDIEGSVEIQPEYAAGLKDLDGFSHIILLYHFHQSEGFSLVVQPFLDDVEHGLFSTRAPKRPNPIGLSVVRLDSIENNILYIRDVDILNETPLLDIKPYIPDFDSREDVHIGWLSGKVQKVSKIKSDKRFGNTGMGE